MLKAEKPKRKQKPDGTRIDGPALIYDTRAVKETLWEDRKRHTRKVPPNLLP